MIVAQGTEGGGHVGWMASLPLLPMVVDAVSPLPVLAGGGIADGRGLAAALALGAQGVLLGTRFLATCEAPLPDSFKAAILASDGHDTDIGEIPDIARGRVWPGAMARCAATPLSSAGQGGSGPCARNRPRPPAISPKPANQGMRTTRYCISVRMRD